MNDAALPLPHGGSLVDLRVPPERLEAVRVLAARAPSVTLDERAGCDLELLSTGAFSPLTGFLGCEAHESVCERMRLPDDTLWPIPVTLDVPEAVGRELKSGDPLALRDGDGTLLGVLRVSDAWRPDRVAEARAVYGTDGRDHPGVRTLLSSSGWYVGGTVEVMRLPFRPGWGGLRLSPADLRARLASLSWTRVVAFQTRNPLHRAHVELTRRAMRDSGAKLLLHPVVGPTAPGDVDAWTRLACYQAVMPAYGDGEALLAVLPLAMRMAGPREAVWHALIRRNHGATHFIVGRDHAGARSLESGKPFHGPRDAQELALSLRSELGVELLPYPEMVYDEERGAFLPEDEVPPGTRVRGVSGTELRGMLARGERPPEWFTYPGVADVLARRHPPRARQGVAIFLTGLPSSGKSTLARELEAALLAEGRRVTLLDGDIVRRHLSKGLGFSREDRDTNIRRIGFVAAEVVRHGGVAICAAIAPFDAVRREVRGAVEAEGGFLLVHLATTAGVCEARDPKGLWTAARAGRLSGFTGVDDPYEPPADAELTLDASSAAPQDLAAIVMARLRADGYLSVTG